MLKLFIAAISVGLIYWVWLKKKQIFSNRNNKIDPFITTIEAIEIQTFLDWNTSQYCLECDGIRYGKQFKQKKRQTYHMRPDVAVRPPNYSILLMTFFKVLHLF